MSQICTFPTKNSFFSILEGSKHCCLIVFFFFLPFSQALTIDIGFPLKISEIALTCLVFLYLIGYTLSLYSFSIDTFPPNSKKIFYIFLFFLLLVVTSFCINYNWSYTYPLNYSEYRFGLHINSFLKTIYTFSAACTVLVASKAFKRNRILYVQVICWGAVTSGLYGWYLFIYSLNNWPVLLLPGMDAWPQHGLFSFGHFIRCGTFKEGNYAGLFFSLAFVLSLYIRKYILSLLILLSLIPTVSAMGFASLALFIIIFCAFHLIRKKKYIYILLVLAIVISAPVLLSSNKDIAFLTTKFIPIDDKQGDHEDAHNSRNERLNLISIATDIGMNNPFFGVGLSNFSAHLQEYNRSVKYNLDDSKTYIVNNVYFEILAELGFPALILFLSLWVIIVRSALNDSTGLALSGIIIILFYLIAFPTFSVLYVWVFTAFAISFDEKKTFYKRTISNPVNHRSSTICD